MFRSYCAPCHGENGRGTGPAASALKKAPAALTVRDMPMWGDLFRSVSSGNPGVEMRITNLSNYIRDIQEK
jgi:cytochrome c553